MNVLHGMAEQWILYHKFQIICKRILKHLTYTYPKSYELIFNKKCWHNFFKKLNHSGLSHIKKCWNMTQLGSLRLQILTSASVCCCVIRHKSELSFQSPNLQMTSIITTTIISYLTICPYFKFNLQITILIVITSVISFL